MFQDNEIYLYYTSWVNLNLEILLGISVEWLAYLCLE